MLELSGKLIFLFELLEQTKQLKEKVLVFSQSLLTLDLIEEFLSKPKFGDWIRAVDYYRLDGSTSADMRTANMSEFNQTDNERYGGKITIIFLSQIIYLFIIYLYLFIYLLFIFIYYCGWCVFVQVKALLDIDKGWLTWG